MKTDPDLTIDPDPEDSVDEAPEPTRVKYRMPTIILVAAWMTVATLGYLWIDYFLKRFGGIGL